MLTRLIFNLIIKLSVTNVLHTCIKAILLYFSGKKPVDNNFVNYSLNVSNFLMLIDNVAIDKSHDCGCYGNHFGWKL